MINQMLFILSDSDNIDYYSKTFMYIVIRVCNNLLLFIAYATGYILYIHRYNYG